MNNVQKFMMLLGKFYQKSGQTYDLIDEEIYLGGIEPIGIDRALDALMMIARMKGLSKIPSVGDILEAAGIKEPSAVDDAHQILGRIFEAASKFGGYQAERAANYIGELGWVAVQRFGGWDAFCMIEEDDFGTARAQLRDIIKSVNAYDSVGRLQESSSDVKKALEMATQGILVIGK